LSDTWITWWHSRASGIFARAAAACNVTQPTLSAGIKQLEESLGVLIVERRQRFVGFTPEGERVLAWSQRMLADYGGLTQELSELREGLAGQPRIGAIPVSLPALALLTVPFGAIHAKTRLQITSQTSIEIQRELDDFTIDIGLTYLDNDPLSRVRTVPLYRERYVLITHEASGFSGLKSISWAKAATLPLCLLTPSMQNRRIVDAQFRAAGAQVNAVMETNSLPHISGTSLSAQTRYAAGTREILECYFENRLIRNEYLIVQGGELAGVGAHSYSAGNARKDRKTPPSLKARNP
jgi:DNA-binding transcriptional LysR family regulator